VWNPWKTLTERDSARLRRLEATVDDISADIERILAQYERLNARLRQRAARASEASSDDADRASDGADGNLGRHVPDIPRGPSLEQTNSETVKYTKDQLRAFAHQRGIRA